MFVEMCLFCKIIQLKKYFELVPGFDSLIICSRKSKKIDFMEGQIGIYLYSIVILVWHII